MRSNYRADAERLDRALRVYEAEYGPLPGIVDPEARAVFIEQLIDSEQRVLYTDRLQARVLDPLSADPRDGGFDPIKAALLHRDAGDFDEAVWLVYLFVHFGKHRRAGWRYIRGLYGSFGAGPDEWWTWERTSSDPTLFRFWLDAHQDDFHADPGSHGFGNHRKYVSLNAWDEQGTGAAIQSYVEWATSEGAGHATKFASLKRPTPEISFDALYASLNDVRQFGRVAKFDYLMMLTKLRLVDIYPPHSYIVGATGPLRGAKLLLQDEGDDGRARGLQEDLIILGRSIGVRPDVLEDAICNWQKKPRDYIKFSG